MVMAFWLRAGWILTLPCWAIVAVFILVQLVTESHHDRYLPNDFCTPTKYELLKYHKVTELFPLGWDKRWRGYEQYDLYLASAIDSDAKVRGSRLDFVDAQLQGKPILFIPGNRGHYGQVSRLASKVFTSRDRSYDVFTRKILCILTKIY